ncbi:MAG: NADH-quinone oxidoreductase subunit J [Ilumatobacteraceae bacterium]|nr:NADH-quinone oxidoreductase subunit J [Acidimicrobiales bacterium]MCB9392081.1 NADH-quinone oxidoreductase subunit J [Acidimicrobiaceae bacterium]
MTVEFVVFVCAAAMVLLGAVGVIVRNHPVHAALSLVLTLFGVAVLFVAQEAHFLAAVQVIVYAGAIVVLFLFVIMLLGVDRSENLQIEPISVQRPLAAIVGAGTLAMILLAVVQARDAVRTDSGLGLDDATVTGDPDSNIRQIARDLFSNHVFAFELVSVLLVVAVVATVLLSRRPDKLGAVDSGTSGSSKVSGGVR